MRVPCGQLMCGLAATALLGGCAANGGHPGTAPISAAPTTPTATAVTATATPQPGARTAKWIDLQVGDCVADLPPADLSRITVTIVDCATSLVPASRRKIAHFGTKMGDFASARQFSGVARGLLDQLDTRGDAQLGVDVGQVGLHGAG